MLLVIQWIGIRQAMGLGKKERRASEKPKGKAKCHLGKWLEKKKEKYWDKKKRGEKEVEGCREEEKKEVDEIEVRVEENREDVIEVRVEGNKEEVEHEREKREEAEDLAEFKKCGCEACEEYMYMRKELAKCLSILEITTQEEEGSEETREEAAKKQDYGASMDESGYLGDIEDFEPEPVCEVCDCKEYEEYSGGCMIMQKRVNGVK